jgi:hypothetical protein
MIFFAELKRRNAELRKTPVRPRDLLTELKRYGR